MNEPLPDMIERSVLLRATPARVWRALVTPAEFSAWFSVRMRGELVEGARVEMTSTHPDHEGTEFFMVVEKLVPERLFSWRWLAGADCDASDPMTHVALTISEEAGGTRLTVTERGFAQLSLVRQRKALAENTEGWAIQLRSLEAHVQRTA